MISIVCKVVPQFEIPISANEMAGKASECVQVTFFQSTKWLTRLRPSTSRPYHSYPICYCTLRWRKASEVHARAERQKWRIDRLYAILFFQLLQFGIKTKRNENSALFSSEKYIVALHVL